MNIDTKLDVQLQATVSGGTAVVQFGPHGESWRITRVFVKTSTKVLESQCTLYRNQIGDLYAEDTTFTASTGDTSDTVFDLTDGEKMYAVWTGADNGAIATLTISGLKSRPSGGFRAVPQ